MADPKLPAAKRRLALLLRDEEYGPKLARLDRKGEREILDLIYENRGRDARRRLAELDARRREHRNTADRVRKYRSLSRRQRHDQHPTDETPEFWDMYGPDQSGPLE